ncbi:nicotinic acid mononucleotide adenylyltransferase [Bacillus sp. V3-13]|uniref:nicotinate-nucleotide adenylyltransferase n=1 Tax=Bacillus sp. V3-13 TaxID=2053728 RepID=UPI000C76F1BD|nr:nicotinate-nucleotide adenylyltransferase [Bacillus sp. V3-13]PLR78086.1 nicotinic acid mononucleotide adenylyltransferase [Bacillus sp. V3-13]
MRKIGILGGTFDPPHYGHLLIANEVLEALNLEEIWFMPNQDPPHKDKAKVQSGHRFRMLELAIEDHPRFRIEPLELTREGRSYTIETMQLLKNKYNNISFYFLIGADMIEYLPNWHRIDELMEMVEFVGVKRPSYSHHTPFPITYVEVPEMGVSSSMLRERLREGKTVRYLLPDPVRNYIEENNLYGT